MSWVMLLAGAVPPTQLAPVVKAVPLLFQTMVAAEAGLTTDAIRIAAPITARQIRSMNMPRAMR
jgi:hypothetical protein